MGTHLMSLTGELRYEPVARRVRASLHGAPVLDTTDAAVVWEPRRLVPMYAAPPEDLAATLVPRPRVTVPDRLPPVLGPLHFEWHHGAGQSYDLVVGDHTVAAAGFAPDDPDLGGRVVVEWAPFDWMEEALSVVGHPHDPFKRIDLLPSERHVVVRPAGWCSPTRTGRSPCARRSSRPVGTSPTTTSSPTCSSGSTTTSTCAYKGHAADVSLGPDAVPGIGAEGHDIGWTYPRPAARGRCGQAMFCFWSERTDLELDGPGRAPAGHPVVVPPRAGLSGAGPSTAATAASTTPWSPENALPGPPVGQ